MEDKLKVYTKNIETELNSEFEIDFEIDGIDLMNLLSSGEIGTKTRVTRTHFSAAGKGEEVLIGFRTFRIRLGEKDQEEAPEEHGQEEKV